MAELRQIRTLRLAASRREQVPRAAIALEDAMRTASLPQLPRGAMLLVRRLNLGRLPADASPQWLSRHIETRLRALQATPLRIRQDDRPDAPAVWFADRSEALAALLATSLRGTPRAWYWVGVLPDWQPGMSMGELLPLVLHAAEAESEPVGVAALLDRLLKLDRLDPVLRHLEPAHLAALSGPSHFAATGRRSPGRDQPELARMMVTTIASDAWQAVLAKWVGQWGTVDPRSRWLVSHALIAVHGPTAAVRAEGLITRLSKTASMSPPTPTKIAADQPMPPALEAAPEPARAIPPILREKAPYNPPPDALPSAEADWRPSRHAGLLLLLPAIARLEIAEADPEGDLCLVLLHRIADRLRIRKDDPIRSALPKPLPGQPRAFVPPAAWQSLLRLPPDADLGRTDWLLAACQLILARFLRRYARISLRRLVRRPALVHATRTHIDLRFDPRWVELDLRLAGLDLDPGWVPWLGRVVTFHYDYEGGS